jgi:hypothetical protein
VFPSLGLILILIVVAVVVVAVVVVMMLWSYLPHEFVEIVVIFSLMSIVVADTVDTVVEDDDERDNDGEGVEQEGAFVAFGVVEHDTVASVKGFVAVDTLCVVKMIAVVAIALMTQLLPDEVLLEEDIDPTMKYDDHHMNPDQNHYLNNSKRRILYDAKDWQ